MLFDRLIDNCERVASSFILLTASTLLCAFGVLLSIVAIMCYCGLYIGHHDLSDEYYEQCTAKRYRLIGL